MSEPRTIKVFLIHQWILEDLYQKVTRDLQNYPFCNFVNLSYPKSNPIPPDKEEFIQDIVCGTMMEADIVMILPDTEEDFSGFEDGEDYLSDLSDPFRKNRGLHPYSTYAVEIKTLMFDSADTKPALVLGWTKDRANYLVDKLQNPRIGGRAFNPDRFHVMGLDEAQQTDAIAERILAILAD